MRILPFSIAALLCSAPALALEIPGKAVPTTQEDTHSARGVLIAGQSADIAAGMTGRLISAPWKPGQYVKTDAVLAEFDCDRGRAELDARRTAHKTLSLKHDNQAELFEFGAAGALDVSIAKSERDQVAAETRALEISLKDCIIRAPFPAYVTARHVDAYETPQAGQPLYSLNRAGTTEISVIAPSDWAAWAKPGQRFSFRVDETGETIPAKVLRLSAVVDPVSQTIELTARPSAKFKARPGMSGVAVFEAR